MLRNSLALFFALALLTICSNASSETASPAKFSVRIRVLQESGEQGVGKPVAKVLAEPTLLIAAGRTASMIAGSELADFSAVEVGEKDSANTIFLGTKMEVVAGKVQDGKVRLDLTLDVSERMPAPAERLDVRHYGVRTAGLFEFGKPIRVSGPNVAERGSTWVEVTVQPVVD